MTLATAIAAGILQLQTSALDSRDAEQRLTALRLDLAQVQFVPWGAEEGGDGPAMVTDELTDYETHITETINSLRREAGLREYDQVMVPFRAAMRSLWDIFQAVSTGRPDDAQAPSEVSAREMFKADEALQRAARRYHSDAAGAVLRAKVGSGALLGLLFAAFAWFYRRERRGRSAALLLARENHRLAAASERDARTDALTGLPNRRALLSDLELALETAKGTGTSHLFLLFDLNGFKQYNDRFGHPAGDALLERLGNRLSAAVEGRGVAYRLGGDEFCVIAPAADPDDAERVTSMAAAALTETGAGFHIDAAHGSARLPAEATDVGAALQVADHHMYARKGSRSSAGRQSADVLLRLLAERYRPLGQQLADVASSAAATADQLGLPTAEVERIRLAAELHDIGLAALPDAILRTTEPLSDSERDFYRCHPLIGERIVSAAPALAHTADLIRLHEERIDGSGYPDGLSGQEIPIGARIIAVCQTFHSLAAGFHHEAPLTHDEALAALSRQASTKYDAQVVAALAATLEHGDAAARHHDAERTGPSRGPAASEPLPAT